METILEVKGLNKKYKHERALDNVSLKINKGDIYGLVGRNGAGKTTLMKVITTLIKQDSGTVVLFNSTNKSEYQKSLTRTASIIESPVCYENLTAKENLIYYCKLRGIKDQSEIENILSFVGLSHTGKKKVKDYSLGMRQRMGLAIALISNPDFIILDEPINGLDPIAIIEFRELIEKINHELNTTILISSHILSELYQVSNRFGFIHEGRILEEITKTDLDDKNKECIIIKSEYPKELTSILDKENYKFKLFDRNTIRVYDDVKVSKLNKLIVNYDIEVESIYKESSNLEDYFKNLIEGENR